MVFLIIMGILPHAEEKKIMHLVLSSAQTDENAVHMRQWGARDDVQGSRTNRSRAILPGRSVGIPSKHRPPVTVTGHASVEHGGISMWRKDAAYSVRAATRELHSV